MTVTAVLVLACLPARAQPASTQYAETITISVAASLRTVMDSIAQVYSERRAAVKVVYNFGASGALQQQIEQGGSVLIVRC
jgi:molybdate transport system substrate-binding protein